MPDTSSNTQKGGYKSSGRIYTKTRKVAQYKKRRDSKSRTKSGKTRTTPTIRRNSRRTKMKRYGKVRKNSRKSKNSF